MNEVEKMYENAKIEKIYDCCICPYVDCEDRCKVDMETNYPPFTTEKQFELIKWLIQKESYDERIIRSNFEQTYFYRTYIDDYGDYCESEYFEKFEEALANVVNYYWQDLTEEERKQIKEILE